MKVPEFVTAEQLARWLKTTPARIHRLHRQGILPPYACWRRGKHKRLCKAWDRADIRRFIHARYSLYGIKGMLLNGPLYPPRWVPPPNPRPHFSCYVRPTNLPRK